ncbi:MAG: helix-turn-helix domain-containing protein [Acidimicrobiia bacterium]
MDKLLLTVEETAGLIGIGRTKVFELIASGVLESVRIGGARRVPTAAVADYVERLRSEAGGRRLETAT